MKNKRLIGIKGIIVILLAIYFLNICYQKKMLINELENKIARQEKKIEHISSDIEALKEKTKQGKSLEFVESVARDELNMVKPGEYIYVERDRDENEKSNDKKIESQDER